MITGRDSSKRGRRVKRDGQMLRAKDEICKDYDQSMLPYPVKNLLKLDYCWKLNYTMMIHSFYMACPITMCYHIYTRMPECWKYTRKTFPFKVLAMNYCAVWLVCNSFNIGWSLVFEDYCKRSSKIYDIKQRNAHALRKIINDTNT